MSIQFSGLGSGLPVDNIIQQLLALERKPIELLQAQKTKINNQQTQFNAVSTRISALEGAISKITDSRFGATDLFKAKSLTSSKTTDVTGSASSSAPISSFTLDVLNLATATKATSTGAIGNWSTTASNVDDVADGRITEGNFTVYINNQAQTIAVDPDADTVDAVLNRIESAIQTVTGVAATGTVTAEGKIQLSYTAGTTISFGANGDTSNFATVTKLNTGSANGGLSSFTAEYGTSTINTDGTLIGNAVGLQTNSITAGTVTIGGDTFTIDSTTTLDDLISDINSSSDADVVASYDRLNNKFTLTAKSTGNQAITLNDGGTGVLAALKLVSGSDTLSSQDLGENAQFRIDGGATIQSTSNTGIGQEISGLTGVTLNLLNETTSAVTVSISQDTEALTEAVSDFISKFNGVLSYIDQQTAKDGVLFSNTRLTSLRNTLRTQISDRIGSLETYSALSLAGIGTGDIDETPAEGKPSTTFRLDEAKLLNALADNPEEVKKLFIGDGTTDGILTRLAETIDGTQDPENGLFKAQQSTTTNRVSEINDAIARNQARVDAKEKQLRIQFTALEKLISGLKDQQNALSALTQNLAR